MKCGCVFCEAKRPFDMPEGLLDDFLNGKVVLFAGAGISTENRLVLKSTFYEDIADDLGYEDCQLPFSELMDEYCKRPNGRINLLMRIKERFQHIKSFPELYRNATRFHRELATFYPLDAIITTNWDIHFEQECGATPFINDEDLAFWDAPGRKVLKIHGSIENYGSIIATKEEYKRCKTKLARGIIGSVLKIILATKTIVYVGYSCRDEDFLSISAYVRKKMKGLNKQAYIVTLDEMNDSKYRALGLIPIYTDGTYFISQIKKHAENKNLLLPDFIYELAELMLKVLALAHERLSSDYDCRKNPEVMMCAAYQDGLIHGFERMTELRKTGEYSHSCQIMSAIEVYRKLRKEFNGRRRYEDVAYIDGYLNSLAFILLALEKKQKTKLPLYYVFGVGEIDTYKKYRKLVPSMPDLHKGSYQRAKEILAALSSAGHPINYHHMPWL